MHKHVQPRHSAVTVSSPRNPKCALLVQVVSLTDRAQAIAAAADRAEEDASVAMRRAETGVREEMEAAAVVKETESALTKALAELTFLETSYEEKDFESSAEKVKAKEKAQKQAEAAVKDALATVSASVTGAAVDAAGQSLSPMPSTSCQALVMHTA